VSGTSRSGTVAIAHCMQQRCMNFNDALACVRRGRASVHPNSGFWRQLRELEAAMRQAGSLPSTQTTSTSTGNSTGSGSAASVPPLATARSAAAAASAPTRGADCVAAPKIDDKTVTQEVGLETGSESHSKPGAGPNKFPKGGDLPSSDKDKVDEDDDDDDDDDELALSALVVDAAEDERLAALEAEAAANAANAANAASGTEATQAQAPDSEVRHASSSPGGSCSNSCSNSSSSEGNNTENSLGSSSVVLVEPPVADDDATAVAASATGLLDTFAEASTAESPSDASTGVAKEESTGTGASESSEKGSGLSSSEGAATDEWVVVADSD